VLASLVVHVVASLVDVVHDALVQLVVVRVALVQLVVVHELVHLVDVFALQ
jgi:hypothetical protein